MAFFDEMDGTRHSFHIQYLPATVECFDEEYIDDISIIDISRPSALRYSFEGAYYLDILNNLNAIQYLRACDPQDLDPLASDEDQEQEVLDDYALTQFAGCLDDMPVLTSDVLAEVWPREFETDSETSCDDAVLDDTNYQAPPTAPVDSLNEVPMTLETITGLLRASPDSVVNLSNRALLPEDLLKILSSLPPFSRLDISRNSAIDKATLSQIMQEHRLEWLNIYECGISGDDIIDLLTTQAPLFRGVEAIIHPTFFSRENLLSWDRSWKTKPLDIPNAFRFCYNFNSHLSLPFFGTDQIVQTLLRFAETLVRRPSGISGIHQWVPFTALQCFLGCSARRDGRLWGEREVQGIPREIRGSDDRNGYRFILSTMVGFCALPREFWRRKKVYQYGVTLPGCEERFVDLATFFRHLEEEGWPKPRDQEAVARVIELFNRDGALLPANAEAVMKEVFEEVGPPILAGILPVMRPLVQKVPVNREEVSTYDVRFVAGLVDLLQSATRFTISANDGIGSMGPSSCPCFCEFV
ncbi:hypothetical protein NMY22_g2001 [Coprinellus aureogranulatus]|nr:hypothetical protein NMY22_g2001 [Coprinellus aureogranulatus]